MKCAICGSTVLIAGSLVGQDGSTIGFQPSDAPWLKRVLALGRRGVSVYGCLHCRHLQLAVEFSDSDLEQYQQFEGEQPDVLERLNSEPQEPPE